ncbi:MAG: DUF6785 family protein [Armatimonadota bacterium]
MATTTHNSADGGESAASPVPRLRWKNVFLVALPLIALDSFWIILAERVGTGPYFTTISLFANVFFLLTLVLIANAAVGRWGPKGAAFTQAELLLVYSMIAVGAAIGGQDTLPGLIQMVAHPYHFGTVGNGYLEHFGKYLPSALMVSDTTALDAYYKGNSSLYQPENYRPWLRPDLLWTGFFVLLFGTMQCINVLVRQGWQDRERLPFPVIEIPLQMTEPGGRLWRDRLFWLGFSLVAIIELLNGLGYLYPNVPTLNLQYVDMTGQGIFATRPWSAVDFTAYSFYPFAIGLGYLLPLDLLFSSWFFYLFWKAQLVLSAHLALDTTPDFPFVREQAFGSFFAILAGMFWNSRHYFRQVWNRAWDGSREIEDRDEGLSYRWAMAGAVAGFACLIGFMSWAGLSPLVAALAFLIYFCISLTVTRIRAELGPPVHDLHFSGPDYMLTHSLGTQSFSTQDLTLLSFFYSFNRAYRSHPQPFAMEGLKVARQTGVSQSTVFWSLMVAALIGALSFFWAYLHLAYSLGTQAKFASGSSYAAEAYNRLNGWVQAPTRPNGMAGLATLVGFVFCAGLMVLRTRLPWWPLHPIGFAISSSWAMNLVWVPLLIAWVVKALVMRYGGVRLYRQVMPFFIGLILGQMLTGSLWHLIGLALGVTPYSFWGG